MAVADGDESAIHLPNQLASSGSMDLIENEFQFLKDYDSSGVYEGSPTSGRYIRGGHVVNVNFQLLVVVVSSMYPQQFSMTNPLKNTNLKMNQLHLIL